MVQSKMKSLKKLASKVTIFKTEGLLDTDDPSLRVRSETIFTDILTREANGSLDAISSRKLVSPGRFAVYVGEERLRFMVKTKYLTHPLFKMLLEKAHDEYDCDTRDVLVIPCSVLAFREVLNAVERSEGRFDFGELVDEFL